jgi:hypothetical protein
MTSGSIPPLGFVERMKNVMIDITASQFFWPKMIGPISQLARDLVRPDFDLYVSIFVLEIH